MYITTRINQNFNNTLINDTIYLFLDYLIRIGKSGLQNNSFIVEESMNTFTLPNYLHKSIGYFNFLITKLTTFYEIKQQRIGLSFNYRDPKYSIIHQMKLNGLIKSLSYSFIPPIKSIPDHIYFGEIPEQNGKKGACKVIHEEYLQAISFNSNNLFYENINKHRSSSFEVDNYTIEVPQDFFDYITKILSMNS